MKIQEIAPDLVIAVAPLSERLRQDAIAAGFDAARADLFVEGLPPNLKTALCFHDKLTGFWRYEFGEPFYLESQNQLLWGSHMWVPVQYLRRALVCFHRRIPATKRTRYLQRLDEKAKHLDVLSEMLPLLNVNELISADFEVTGRGTGEKEIDWLIGPVGGREVLLDVKSRALDLIQQMDQEPAGDETSAPTHDASLMFRSLETKFASANPSTLLQGAWLATHIKQEEGELRDAFLALDASKIHFAILAHWDPGGLVLVRNEADRLFLCDLFGISENSRFIFHR
jgi:hypothetical protein